jgi:uncharacterized protein (TIGR03790 family)
MSVQFVSPRVRGGLVRAPVSGRGCLRARTAENVAVVINEASAESRQIGEYYVKAREIPAANVIRLKTTTDESIQPAAFVATIQGPIAAALVRNGTLDRVLYIVLTKGIPLRVLGTGGPDGTVASVDSELTLLYRRLTGKAVAARGKIANPYFLGSEHRGSQVVHASRSGYLSRRDSTRSRRKRRFPWSSRHGAVSGRRMLDQRALVNRTGEDWMGSARGEPHETGVGSRVTGHAETGPRHFARDLPFWGLGPVNRERSWRWTCPSAIAATFVSTDARTFKEPPAGGRSPTSTTAPVLRRSPQSLIGVSSRGATGVAGQAQTVSGKRGASRRAVSAYLGD